jgi:uncharacterized membrane protein YgcG
MQQALLSTKVSAATPRLLMPTPLRMFSNEGGDQQQPPKKDGEEDSGRGRKVPSGFEKLLKRSKQSKETKKEKEAKKQENDSDAEGAEESNSGKKEEKKSSGNEYFDSAKNWISQGANPSGGPGGRPPYEQWLMSAMLGGMAGYYLMFSEAPSQEITYMDFLHTYLAQRDIEMITICEDKGNDSFKYRANITTKSGKSVHVVLPSFENFLMKLDEAQREMNIEVSSFVPVKYGPPNEGQTYSPINLMIGGTFVMLLAMLYRNMHGKGGGSSGKSTGSKGKGGFGGGGMGGMMDMQKSGAQVYGVDKKIRTKFKHVAGM